jgi:hydroxymethylglutaryl-CoA synthase
MIGITSLGVYVPYRRISRSIIAKEWGRRALKGERSVANSDEDSVTMAVEAAMHCLRTTNRSEMDGFYFASTTAPYKEKSNAGLAATACDLKDEIITADFANSLRAGTSALKAALDTVTSGSAKNILVAAADCRLGYPKSDQEQLIGDGAASLTVGNDNVIASFEAYYSVNNEIVDMWRNPEDTYIRIGEGRFIMDEGYNRSMKQVVDGILQKTGYKPGDFKKIILSTPDMKSYQKIAKKCGFEPEKVQDALMLEVGNCGTAQPLMLLAAALQEAEPGDLFLLAAYGNGADAFIFKATENIKEVTGRNSLKKYLHAKMSLPSYTKYLSFRGLLEGEPGEPFRTLPSNAPYWRDQKSILRFYGSRCKKCGESVFPIQRVCNGCGSVDQYEEISCAEKTAKMFTYTIDNLAGRSDDPTIVQSVVDADDGTRFYMLMTDCDPSEVTIGMEVEFTFRRFYEGADFHNYFWKCRPVRNEE